ncbi:MAG: tRNA (N(6)-L-threonylcarbamoyladenosine(37)-C(2))-methylthiotransferase MtaB [Candidatus Cloacimonetes bacterium HGW-Cloacimonetes-3]|jgi:threonylcarbamoyladenosine tRNA methylthiotransferase MtaB|nr:MAG: tRNA (N(6)-L-threonylcarbamoyladenosine(37)-C(2))-methylthiotransferase MtaB [Candidatus Cloacimonetes bacterium HGW-Cloacimonetes-3]
MERTAPGTYKIAVLSSGHSRGSNLAAMHGYWQMHRLPVEIALAVFTRSDSPAFNLAQELGIPSVVVSTRNMPAFEAEVLRLCKAEGIVLIALAGFLKQLSNEFINSIGIPILNIHPALLPKYGGRGMFGMAVHNAVHEAGEKLSGATVHQVDPLYDHGSIVAQNRVDVTECPTPEAIASKVLTVEHQLYAPSIYQFLTRPKTRIATRTLGCKTNQAESAIILDQFPKGAVELVDWDSEADIYLINTCTVTNRTDYKSRYHIRQALVRKVVNPNVKIIVTGCYAQRSKDEIALLGEVDYIVDNQQKLNIATLLATHNHSFTDIMQATNFSYQPVTNMQGHTRAFQKIQDGCDFYCAYCAVPYARGHNRSATMEQVLEQARLFVQNGFKEIVLGGVNLGLYKDEAHTLAHVVTAMAQIEGLELIRLSSIEPQLFTQQLIDQLRTIDKVCPHFHIPLQSGSDTVLKRMGRRYDTALVQALVSNVLMAFPDAAIGFDVITGFPGESEAEHNNTYQFLSSLPLAYLHVFSYSKRKGTPADKMPNQVPKDVKHTRTNQLTALSEQMETAYRQKLIADKVLLRGVVEASPNGESEFLSDHYIRVRTSAMIPIGELAIVSP